MAAQAGLCLAESETPQDTFFRVVAKLDLPYLNVLFLPFVGILRLKVVKSIQTEQNLLNNGQSHDAKNNRSDH